MKFLLAVSSFLAFAASQDLSSLPPCGQMCVNNMLGLAPSLGCQATDAKCLCSNANFAHGLNDCSLEACGAAVQAAVVAYGTSYCSSAGVPLGGSGGSGGTTTTATTTTTAAAGGTTGGTSTATGSAESSASSALSSASSSASNALASASSSINSALSSATKSASGSASGSGSSASSSGFAMRTAAPLAGAGALGLAAVLLV